MELEEHWLHVARRGVVKTTGHLLDARKAFRLAYEHLSLVGNTNDTTRIIANNVFALCEGLEETIKACGQAASDLKNQMQEPDAKCSPAFGGMGTKLTPLQRSLAREGTVFETMPKYVATPAEQKLPKILTFTLKERKKYKDRKRNLGKGIIPL